MAPPRQPSARPNNWVLDYKVAFYGACGLVTVFAGLSWRLFTSDLADTDKLRAISDQDQWVVIRTLERELAETKRDVAICYKDGAALEARIQYIERSKHDRR